MYIHACTYVHNKLIEEKRNMVSILDDHKLSLEYQSSLQGDHPVLFQKDPAQLGPRLPH
jgi:hypothetical protein